MAIQQRTPQPFDTHHGRELGSSRDRGGQAFDEWLTRGLGWFGIGLGLAELLAPRGVARLAGISPQRHRLLRSFGARELASGLGILSQRRPTTWVWSRVAGDVLDLATLAGALASRRSRRHRVLAATAAVAGVTALDVMCGRRLSRGDGASTPQDSGGVRARTVITISRPAEHIYRFWRDFTNLPRVMRHIDSVQVYGERRSHWVARLPGGRRLEWDAEITEDRANELIAWRSSSGGDVETEGSVRFVSAPGDRGTEVHLDMMYRTPMGLLGGGLLNKVASTLVTQDLRALKQVLETGEVMR